MSGSVFLPAKAPHSKPAVLSSTRLPLCKPTMFFQEEYPREWLADKTAAAKAQGSIAKIQPPKRTSAPAPGSQPQAKSYRPKCATPEQSGKVQGVPTGTTKWIPPKQLPAARTIRPDHLVTLPSGMAVSNTLYLKILGWHQLVQTLPATGSKLRERIESEDPQDAIDSIHFTFARGETHTKHQPQVLRFHAWAKSVQREPTVEQTLYKYLRHCLKEGAAATHPSSVISALKFFYGKAEYAEGLATTTTSRVERAREMSMDGKADRREAAPIPTQVVCWMEHECTDDNNPAELRSMLGFFLWTLYSRYRAGESARIKHEPYCEDIDHDEAFLETNTRSEQTKTGQKVHRRGHVMQILTKVKGIAHDCVWAKGWLQARKEMGQHADTDGCLQEDVDRFLIPIGGTVMDATKCTVTHENDAWTPTHQGRHAPRKGVIPELQMHTVDVVQKARHPFRNPKPSGLPRQNQT